LSYVAIAVFLFVRMDNNAMIAGVWLLLDTVVSGYMWYRRDKPRETVQTPKYKTLQLQNLRF
jgi:hypothetical protein